MHGRVMNYMTFCLGEKQGIRVNDMTVGRGIIEQVIFDVSMGEKKLKEILYGKGSCSL